jgi:hypothetical protein
VRIGFLLGVTLEGEGLLLATALERVRIGFLLGATLEGDGLLCDDVFFIYNLALI